MPEPYDGWDETFAPSVAVPGGPGWLRVVARASEIGSDPAVADTRDKLGIYSRTGLLTSGGGAPLPSLE
ncbi:MAG: hypothetical protein JWP60_3564 [Ramlibacter sp.]|nr:hypothetical protein [Ramlibacter sp.]